MKFNLSRILALCALCAVVLFSSCGKDDDDDFSQRDEFVGTFVTAESCTSGTDNYNIVIVAGSEDGELSITNVYDSGTTITGTVDGSDLKIEKQTLESIGSETQTIEGTGTLSGTTLTITADLVSPFGTEVCTFVCTK